MSFQFGLEHMQVLPLLRVCCSRCSKTAATWITDTNGSGDWHKEHRKRCRCDPSPSLPEGQELEKYVARARRINRTDGRPAITLSR
jgi:hypothetical protein